VAASVALTARPPLDIPRLAAQAMTLPWHRGVGAAATVGGREQTRRQQRREASKSYWGAAASVLVELPESAFQVIAAPVSHGPMGDDPIGHAPIGHAPIGHAPIGHSHPLFVASSERPSGAAGAVHSERAPARPTKPGSLRRTLGWPRR
jgi:hypothetical protein